MYNEPITRTLRKQGRNVTWLARRLGMSRRTLYYRMRGEFPVEEQRRIADILDVPDEFLFGEKAGSCAAARIHRENVL